MAQFMFTDQQIGALVREYELQFTYHNNADADIPREQVAVVAITVTSNLGVCGGAPRPISGTGSHIHGALRNFLLKNSNLKSDAESRILGTLLS